ncbi:MAG: glutathione S-transferase [Proteobacteria bacterium]|nr:MAG: glutathione S-transferase [Pseudomonadota bacterium]
MLRLYQFPVSNFCEKARWALEIKELPYRKVNLLIGPHAKKAKQLAGGSSLPILEHNGQCVQGSSDIITYLDNNFSRRKLTPEAPGEARLVEAWESFADREIGPAVRLLCYHTLLDHKDIILPMLTQDGPWYGRMTVGFAFPKMVEAMRAYMKINDASAKAAEEKISTALDNIVETLGDKVFLVGDTFTRADIAVASLLGPLLMHPGYGITWPKEVPEPLASQLQGFNDRLGWVEYMYENFR